MLKAPTVLALPTSRGLKSPTRLAHPSSARHVSTMHEVATPNCDLHAGYVQKQHPLINSLKRASIWKKVCKIVPNWEICQSFIRWSFFKTIRNFPYITWGHISCKTTLISIYWIQLLFTNSWYAICNYLIMKSVNRRAWSLILTIKMANSKNSIHWYTCKTYKNCHKPEPI